MRPVRLLAGLLVALLVQTPQAPVLAAPTPTGAITIYLAPSPYLASKDASDTAIAATAQALGDWANQEIVPVWHLPRVLVVALPRGAKVPTLTRRWVLSLLPYTDDWEAEGYHALSPAGVPYGEIGVVDAQQAQGNWTICASHELAEVLVDPYATSYAVVGATSYAVEVSDPVETHWSGWGDRGVYYQMTDFVYPSYFQAAGRYPYDRLHLVRRPFGVLPGGYQIQEVAGPVTQVAPVIA